jgi:hypothetical protein
MVMRGRLVVDILSCHLTESLKLGGQYIGGGEWKGKKIEEAVRNCHWIEKRNEIDDKLGMLNSIRM